MPEKKESFTEKKESFTDQLDGRKTWNNKCQVVLDLVHYFRIKGESFDSFCSICL